MFLTVGLYVAFFVLMLIAAENVTDDLGFLMGRIQHNCQNSEYGGKSEPFDNSTVNFNFTSITTPPQCMEENFTGLGDNVYISVCKSTINNVHGIVLDIRKFTGTVKTGIKPTIVGINLTLDQWNVSSKNAIDNIVTDLSR